MIEPGDRIFTLAYCSRNRVQGSPAEVRRELQDILTTARRNNARLRITGCCSTTPAASRRSSKAH